MSAPSPCPFSEPHPRLQQVPAPAEQTVLSPDSPFAPASPEALPSRSPRVKPPLPVSLGTLWSPLRAQRCWGALGTRSSLTWGSAPPPRAHCPTTASRPVPPPTTTHQGLPDPSFCSCCKSPRGQRGPEPLFLSEMSQPKLTASVGLPSARRPEGLSTEHRPWVHAVVCTICKIRPPPPAMWRLCSSRPFKPRPPVRRVTPGPNPPAPAPGPAAEPSVDTLRANGGPFLSHSFLVYTAGTNTWSTCKNARRRRTPARPRAPASGAPAMLILSQ